jgi:ribonuclease G
MSEEILINVTPPETRVAVIENGVAQEIIIERTAKRGIVGNIYKGKVCRVLPGMQAAFVDAGLERAAFLHASDIHTEDEQKSDQIADLVREGGEIIVQVVKDPLGTKGARLTTNISIAFALHGVHAQREQHRRVAEDRGRGRAQATARHPAPASSDEHEGINAGYIARTAAEGVSDDRRCRPTCVFCCQVSGAASRNAAEAAPHRRTDPRRPAAGPARAARPGHPRSSGCASIRAPPGRKGPALCAEVHPEITVRIEYYGGERPLFDLYGVEDEIQKALERKVQLKSGGHLVIDQTEAMTTIDVNTGAFVGHRNLEETIFKTNLEAAQAICRQLRLRNLGGIIIIDFIDMTDEEHKRQVCARWKVPGP